ncbi:MAG: hypothetical protein QGG64_10030 [Candidatus Latescibacteria bacterium]|jgi:hypothetical protein|nr:hypothetical protein [Candidatus Latescibacterota bacterium]
MRQSHTAVVERNVIWSGAFETEPYEAGWANEAIFFVRSLNVSGDVSGAEARVQISPDGMRWCDEGTVISLSGEVDGVAFGKVCHFGMFLRLVGELPGGAEMTVIVYLSLKE